MELLLSGLIILTLPSNYVTLPSNYVHNQLLCDYDLRHMSCLINELSKTFLFLANFNAHSPVWGSSHSDVPLKIC